MLKSKATQVFLFLSLSLLLQTAYAGKGKVLITTGEYVSLQTNSELNFRAYVAGPKSAKQGILLIHGWWGLNQEVEKWTNKFASLGYRVIALDLFNNKVTTNPTVAKKFIADMKQSEANEKYIAALNYLAKPDRKLAVVGRSFGAMQALEASMAAPEKISATVMYYPYGKLGTDKNKLRKINTPVLAHFAQKDFFLTPAKRDKFVSEINNAGIYMSVNIYDARHGFDKPTSKNYDESAHRLAWKKSNQFLELLE